MLASKKFKETFNKAFNKFTDLLLPYDDLQQSYQESFNGKISKEKCQSVRNSVIKCFKNSVNEEFDKLCDELQVEEKLLIKQNLITEQKNQPPNSGWRPTGDANYDTFGDKRPIQIKHLKNLKSLDTELEDQLKKLKKALEREHRILKAEVESCD